MWREIDRRKKGKIENFSNLLTPFLVSIAIAIMGVIWSTVTTTQDTVNDLRERMSKVEQVIHDKLNPD